MIKDYGIIKGKIFQFETEFDLLSHEERSVGSPHYNFSIKLNHLIYQANINIFSINPESPDLKIYVPHNPNIELKNKSVFMNAMKLQDGIYTNLNKNLAIDYIRGKYFDLNKLKIYTNRKEVEEAILYFLLDDHLKKAKKNNYDITLWGQLYKNIKEDGCIKRGIHDIHMNQGNMNRIDNGIYNDGLIMISTKTDIKFVCFIAFSGQCLKTDENGNCL